MPKVLVIEDDPTMLSLLKTLMELEGYQVVILSGDIDPLPTLRSERPDLVLIDVNLKSASGIDLLRSVREDSTIRSVKVIMSSGMDMSDICLENGADDFILKPFMPDDLLDRVRNLIRKNDTN